ncbi:dual oxidase maturation factor 1-like isoform X2 [Uloborus diversus]|uniref:dual oxidase maturation factor 1-like isoform X2 n=1 Tax=Uloborus diversus TaxID=327109 RepID=UPI00240A6AE8|nr:dual oxidase maturation factor 1-like isoform X2 [Uloborus diversus]
MLRGWFDAFRVDGGPTLYSHANRTPVVEDIRNILIYVSFSTLFIAFLLIFPGIRKERVSTLITVTTSLFVGAVILLSNNGTDWHVSEGSISTPYRAFSKEKLYADISVRIGLTSVNVTLQANPIHKNSEDINYNERFNWVEATQLKTEFREALIKGLPFPILTIAEYLSQNMEGFSWGGKYRKAGYYTSIMLWTSFAIWMVMNILLCMVPRYGAYAMVLTGLLVLSANAIYALLLPKIPLIIHFEVQVLTFSFGWCFWILVVAGTLSVIVGTAMSIIDNFFPNKFSTIFEVDYDTPYRYFVGQDTSAAGPTPVREHLSLGPVSATPFPVLSPAHNAPSDGLVNGAFDDDEDEDKGREYGTIVNGKRAVSLKNFGKFAQKEAGRRKQLSYMQRKINSFSGPHISPRGKDVNIDMKSVAGIW